MRCGRQWLWTIGIALGAVLVFASISRLCAQEPLLWARNVAGDSRPIQIAADEAVTWVEQGKRVILLKGKVWVEQGDANLRATQAVVWLPDDATQKKSGIYRMELYSDGGVSLEVGAQSYEAPLAMIELNTRGAVNVKTFKNKISKTPTPEDPLLRRALSAMKGQPKPAQPSAPAKNPIQRLSKKDTLILSNEAAAPDEPAPIASTPANIQQTQWTVQAVQPEAGPLGVPLGPGAQPVQPPVGPQGSPVAPQPPPFVVTPVPVAEPPDQEFIFEKPQPEFSIRSRSSEPFRLAQEFTNESGEKAIVLSPGIIIRIVEPPVLPAGAFGVPVFPKVVEIEADRAVLWTKGDIRDLLQDSGVQRTPGERRLEFYLSGNVEIRNGAPVKNGIEAKTIRCSEAYVDVNRNVAVALDADLEVKQPGLPDPVHVCVPVLHQLNEQLFAAPQSRVNASKLPYGPGVYVTSGQATLEQKKVEKKSIFGAQYYDRLTGELEYEDQLLFRGKNVVVWLEDIPVFWLPFLQGDARDPLGPLESLNIGYNRVFGFQFYSTFNVYDLIGIDPIPGTRWRVHLDGMSERGPSLGTDFAAVGKELGGIPGNYFINAKAMGIHDSGVDIIGGDRGEFVKYGSPLITLPITHPEWRGRFLGNLNWQDLPYGLTVQAQLAAISDKNFLDQYYNLEWLNGPNQETFLYAKQQQNNWALTGLVEPRIRNWITETQWLPKVGGHLIGQDVFQVLTYTTRASAGYGRLLPTHQPPPAYEPTDVDVGAGRFDWWNELALPLQLGAFKVVPYGVVDLTHYTQTIPGPDESRFYGGGGVRGSIPFSRLYPDVQSELFNLNAIYHKIVMSGNYYWAHSDRSHLLFPQFDRLNDDASDQALRDIFPQQFLLNPSNAAMLTSGFFDPQLYALRKLVLDKVDTLDSIEVVQLDLRQRWQTKRGFPGRQHIIDWMTLDLSASVFPQSSRDNFGELMNFLEYDWSWNIGDRFTLFSGGWYDPHEGGARVWNIGTQMNRPDTSSLYLGYRQIDPLESRQVIAAVAVPFSAKYSVAASTSYDFGVNNQINGLSITRTGTDLMVSMGFTYNSILNNFGFIFEIMPNLLPAHRRVPGFGSYLASTLRQGI